VKIWTYLLITPERFQTEYVDTGLVDVSDHDEFPLRMLSYGRECVHGEGKWDAVTTRCRGVIYRTDTEEIIARPFEKFFNLWAGMPETDPSTWEPSKDSWWQTPTPEVWEKMDGFLATLYEWEGKQYIASKGSFDSPHAKWATAWLQKGPPLKFPAGYTPVFEGISPNFRIIVDYEKREELVLLALVNNETGEELNRESLNLWANKNDLSLPVEFDYTWQQAAEKSNDEERKNFEGYVLVWRRPGTTPFRLKVKYADYLRLHRMIAHVSPKAIYNCLAEGTRDDLQEWLNESTPWFNKYVAKWVRALEYRYNEIEHKADAAFSVYQGVLNKQYEQTKILPMRKDWAMLINRPESKDVAGVIFAKMDGKDHKRVIWKLCKPLIKNSHLMVDLNRI